MHNRFACRTFISAMCVCVCVCVRLCFTCLCARASISVSRPLAASLTDHSVSFNIRVLNISINRERNIFTFRWDYKWLLVVSITRKPRGKRAFLCHGKKTRALALSHTHHQKIWKYRRQPKMAHTYMRISLMYMRLPASDNLLNKFT